MLRSSVNRWGITDKLFKINNLSGRRRVFTDKITFCETMINRNSRGRGAHKKMRCVTRNDAAQNRIESNNLCTVILGILLSVKKIWWADKCRLCEKVGNLTFALSINWLWINTFVCCINFRLFGGLVSVSAVTYWRVFSGYVLLPMEMSNNLRVVIWSILLSVRKIWWAAKCRLCEKVDNLTFALSANWLWISTFVGCSNFRLVGGLVSVSAVSYWPYR